MSNILKVAKELTHSLLSGINKKLNKECFYMFTVSKFILMKEKILKKDSGTNTIYFDNVKNQKYIPIILKLREQIKELNCEYLINNVNIVYKKNNNIPELSEALWFLNKIRDSLAHGAYEFDLDNETLNINNNHENENNPYKLICNIPINLLNSLSFYVEEIEKNPNYKYDKRDYINYIDNINTIFDFDKYKYYDYYYDIDKYKYYDNPIIDNKSKYYNNPPIIKNNIYYNNLEIDDSIDYYSFNKKKKIEEKSNNNLEFTDDEIEKIIYKNSLKKIKKLVLELSKLQPNNERQKEDIIKLYSRIRKLLEKEKDNQQQDDFRIETTEIIKEMSDILGIKKSVPNKEGVVSLYNYMSLTFAQNQKSNYPYLKLGKINFEFDPLNTNEQYNYGRKNDYENSIKKLRNLCEKFISDMEIKINNYTNHPSDKLRYDLMNSFSEFYNNVIATFGYKNECIITPIRNSIEHGNYLPLYDGIMLYDQKDHMNNKNISFACFNSPQDLLQLSDDINNPELKNNFTMNDFIEELQKCVDDGITNKVISYINKLEDINHAALASLIPQIISQKA